MINPSYVSYLLKQKGYWEMKRVMTFLFFVCITGPSYAQGWEKLNQSEPLACDFRFNGQIRTGDLTGFLNDLESSGLFTPKVGLNSEGGSLAEVYNFLRLLEQSQSIAGIETKIESEASCLSSCAILFMFGKTFGANSPFPLREMERGARLGFHSPFIAPERSAGVDAAEAFRVALDVAKLLIDSSYRALTTEGPALPQELAAVVLGTPSDAMHFVDTIGELEIFGISTVSGDTPKLTLPNNRDEITVVAQRICASSHVMSNRQHFVKEGYAFSDLVQASADMATSETEMHHLKYVPAVASEPAYIVAVLSGPYWVPGWYSAGAMLFCRVVIPVVEKGASLEVIDYRVGFGTPMFDLDSRLPNDEDVRGVRVKAGLIPIDTPFR